MPISELQPKKITELSIGGLRGDFEIPGIGPGYIYFEEDKTLSGVKGTIDSPYGPILVNGLTIETRPLKLVTPTISFNVDKKFHNIDGIKCALNINGQNFVGELVKEEDELPDKTIVYFYTWRKAGYDDEYMLLLPKDIEKLKQIKIEVLTVD